MIALLFALVAIIFLKDKSHMKEIGIGIVGGGYMGMRWLCRQRCSF